MIIIGEKINGAIPSVGKAIQERDAGAIRALAEAQERAGADYLDICAGTPPEQERDALLWLLEAAQSCSELPICLDSPVPETLLAVLPAIQKPGIINSVSGEGTKREAIFPFLNDHSDWKVIVLTCDDGGIPADAIRNTEIALDLIAKAADSGIAPNRLFIDPLALALSAVGDAMIQFMDAVGRIKAAHPEVHITSGLSNISYGMPARSLINRNFLTLALGAGMDSAIMDPTNRAMMENVYATETLLGQDRFGRRYNKAYRAGLIGEKKSG
jgi:5-methyltetrahydrofolate--homocysteine methyltransferase